MAINSQLEPELPNMKFKDVPDDGNRVFYASLKSADDLNGGVITGSLTYNDHGASNGGDSYIRWTPSAAQITALTISAHIHFEVESDFMQDITASAQRLITLGAGPNKMYVGTATDQFFQKIHSGTDINIGALLVQEKRPKDITEIDVIIVGNNVRTFIDGFLVDDQNLISINWSTITLFASNTGAEIWGAGGGSTSRIRNFYLTSSTISTLRSSHDIGNITILGDSLMQQGNLESTHPLFNGNAGDGTFGDKSATARLYHAFQSRGLRTDITNRAASGNNLANTQTIVNGLNQLANHVVVVVIGINDITSGTLTVNWETNYQTLIDDLTTLGANHIFICNITSTAEDATTPDADTANAVDDANAAVISLANANSNVTRVDLFKAFGGHDFKTALYKSNDLHWNVDGSKTSGDLIADTIRKHFHIK